MVIIHDGDDYYDNTIFDDFNYY